MKKQGRKKKSKKLLRKLGTGLEKQEVLGLYYLPPQRKIVMQVGKAEILPVQCSL